MMRGRSTRKLNGARCMGRFSATAPGSLDGFGRCSRYHPPSTRSSVFPSATFFYLSPSLPLLSYSTFPSYPPQPSFSDASYEATSVN
eukprot:2295926-Pyramimonas_sp.AAC.1